MSELSNLVCSTYFGASSTNKYAQLFLYEMTAAILQYVQTPDSHDSTSTQYATCRSHFLVHGVKKSFSVIY